MCELKQARFISKSCGNCGAAVRHRTVWLFLQRKTNVFNDNLKLLHFAPEFCFVNRFKKKGNIEYVSADLNAPRAMKKIDISNIPFSDNHFDVSISIDVLDDVDDDLKAIEELYRITKPNGWGIHLAPINYNLETTFEDPSINTPELRKKHYGAYANKRVYGRDYHHKFKSAGFKPEIYRTESFCSDDEISMMGLNRDFKVYYLKKIS